MGAFLTSSFFPFVFCFNGLERRRAQWSTGREMKIPQQIGNYSDCGVFLCAFASHVVDATDFLFARQDMDSIRARITYELVHGKEEVEGGAR